jgi:hypothetical protein
MLLKLIKRLSAALRGDPAPVPAVAYRASEGREPLLAAIPGETSWHGDHWANLLASPMDARHYVLEDWSIPRPAESFET